MSCVTLPNIFKFVQASDDQFDDAHKSNHCLDVLELAFRFFWTIGEIDGLSQDRTKAIVEASVLLHEQKDRKREKPLNEEDMFQAIMKDGFSKEETEIINWLISYCSFSKSKEPGRYLPEMKKYEKIMNLLSSADLAEAVNEKSLYRSHEYHRVRMIRNGEESNEKECWKHVKIFYNDPTNGFFARLNAISIPEIRESLKDTLEETDKRLNEMLAKFNL
ncbi:hypothetical protein Indivirus_5_35 [Indivirus ILV1]|uniref:HD domain-containing protein n=1 Tax=Indivirus ILV1 TaxID=1977633 RepID=A0A1V0SDY3_9VIRU|nr:hypothetical protein Indivirus_5_35 [Indivirus ILV1]